VCGQGDAGGPTTNGVHPAAGGGGDSRNYFSKHKPSSKASISPRLHRDRRGEAAGCLHGPHQKGTSDMAGMANTQSTLAEELTTKKKGKDSARQSGVKGGPGCPNCLLHQGGGKGGPDNRPGRQIQRRAVWSIWGKRGGGGINEQVTQLFSSYFTRRMEVRKLRTGGKKGNKFTGRGD